MWISIIVNDIDTELHMDASQLILMCILTRWNLFKFCSASSKMSTATATTAKERCRTNNINTWCSCCHVWNAKIRYSIEVSLTNSFCDLYSLVLCRYVFCFHFQAKFKCHCSISFFLQRTLRWECECIVWGITERCCRYYTNQFWI